jgi:hypothetical protein
MKLYRTLITVVDEVTDTFKTKIVWSASAADASKARTAAKSMNRNTKPTTEQVDVPTDKVGLLAFLNAL